MQTLTKKIIDFRDARDWQQFHNPKDLAISLSIEASELLENFQWKGHDADLSGNMENIKDELADVLIYALTMAHDLGIDMEAAILNKMVKNAAKYPVDQSKGSSQKYKEA